MFRSARKPFRFYFNLHYAISCIFSYSNVDVFNRNDVFMLCIKDISISWNKLIINSRHSGNYIRLILLATNLEHVSVCDDVKYDLGFASLCDDVNSVQFTILVFLSVKCFFITDCAFQHLSLGFIQQQNPVEYLL